MTIGVRLKDERVRLGMNQPDFAALVGTTKKTLIEWEAGRTSPTAIQLAVFHKAAGVDVFYVLTGQRTGSSLKPDEVALLDNYRHSPAEGKDAIKRTALALAKPKMRGNAA